MHTQNFIHNFNFIANFSNIFNEFTVKQFFSMHIFSFANEPHKTGAEVAPRNS